jgi:hypothetical protein
MFKRIKQHIINNDSRYLYYKKFNVVFNKFLSFEYKKMIFTGSEEDVLDFSNQSMFYRNDPIEIIMAHTKRKNCKPLSTKEEELAKNINDLIKEDTKENQSLEISLFSGLSNANAHDYGSLKNYGNNLIPRCEWGKGQKSYYGFESDEDYKRLMNDLFESENPIKIAYHHKWTNRYYFHCLNKSHRLAALYRQDINQNRKTKVNLTLYNKELNIESGKKILDNFIGIITTDTTYSFLVEQLKNCYINVLFEEIAPKPRSIYILWIEKSKDELLSKIIKFINLLPLDRCYIISDVLKKYIAV